MIAGRLRAAGLDAEPGRRRRRRDLLRRAADRAEATPGRHAAAVRRLALVRPRRTDGDRHRATSSRAARSGRPRTRRCRARPASPRSGARVGRGVPRPARPGGGPGRRRRQTGPLRRRARKRCTRTVTGSALSRPTWGLGDPRGLDGQGRPGRADSPADRPGRPGRACRSRMRSANIRALSLSRDGTRVAVVAGAGRRGEALDRRGEPGGRTTQVDELRVLEVGDSPVSDVSWSDALSVVALTRSGAESSLYSVDVGGVTDRAAGRHGRPARTARRDRRRPVAAAADHRRGRRCGGHVSPDDAWTRVPDDRALGATAPVYPG